jgi:ribosomal protein S18 acetylase RimI-like enzyme
MRHEVVCLGSIHLEPEKLPAETPKLDARYSVEAATPEDRTLLLAAITRSYSMEPAWSDDLAARVRLAEGIVADGMAGGRSDVRRDQARRADHRHGGIRDSGDKVSNLPLGVCVLNEYRNRGLGAYLLHESLRRLKERGLEEARLVTRKGLPADRFLYPKFGGERVVLAGVPA